MCVYQFINCEQLSTISLYDPSYSDCDPGSRAIKMSTRNLTQHTGIQIICWSPASKIHNNFHVTLWRTNYFKMYEFFFLI